MISLSPRPCPRYLARVEDAVGEAVAHPEGAEPRRAPHNLFEHVGVAVDNRRIPLHPLLRDGTITAASASGGRGRGVLGPDLGVEVLRSGTQKKKEPAVFFAPGRIPFCESRELVRSSLVRVRCRGELDKRGSRRKQ